MRGSLGKLRRAFSNSARAQRNRGDRNRDIAPVPGVFLRHRVAAGPPLEERLPRKPTGQQCDRCPLNKHDRVSIDQLAVSLEKRRVALHCLVKKLNRLPQVLLTSDAESCREKKSLGPAVEVEGGQVGRGRIFQSPLSLLGESLAWS